MKFQKFFRDKVKFSSFFTFLSKTQIFRNFEVKTGGDSFGQKLYTKKNDIYLTLLQYSQFTCLAVELLIQCIGDDTVRDFISGRGGRSSGDTGSFQGGPIF